MSSKYFQMIDRSGEYIKAKNSAAEVALEAVGIQATSHIKRNITSNGRVDTGLYRNSITYAISGKTPKETTYSGTTGSKTGRAGGSGSYNGTAPDDPENKIAVYVGSNVDYGVYVEEGTRKQAGTHDIKNGIADNLNEYKKIMEKTLKNSEN